MPVHTKLEICITEGETRNYLTTRFNESTTMEDIKVYILKKCNSSNPSFNIEIFDQYHELVTLDGDYLDEYAPFDSEKRDASIVQSINSSEKKVVLRVTLSKGVFCSTNDQEYLTVLEEALETATKQYEEIQPMIDAVPGPQAPKIFTICLPKDPKMGFLDGYNVNYRQRDQYICDKVNVDSGKTTGRFIMLQGQKDSTMKHLPVRPQFKIWNDDIKTGAGHCWSILVYLVLDVYELGKRSLFYHPQRIFVANDNENQLMNPYEIPITDINGVDDMIINLQLTTVAIEGAKKHPSLPLKLICNLEDDHENKPNDYKKSRLALVRCKDGESQWETLVLSDEMIFIKKNDTTQVINILDAPTTTASTLSKGKQTKKCQTASNQRSKRIKAVDHSSIMSPSSNNNVSLLLANQNRAMNYHNNRVMSSISQTVSTIPEAGSEVFINSTQTGNLHEDPIDIFNIPMYNSNSSAAMSMNNMPLINNDFSLNFIDGFSIDSPNL